MKSIAVLLLAIVLLLGACSRFAQPPAVPAPVVETPFEQDVQAPTPTATPATPTATSPSAGQPAPTAALPTAVAEQVTFELLAQSGGALTDFVVSGSLAYLAVGPRLVVVEITGSGESGGALAPVFASEPLAGTASELALDGGKLYWLSSEAGVLIFDLADPRQPVLTGVKQVYTDTKRMAVAADHGYFAAWDCVEQGMAGAPECTAQLTTTLLSELNSLGGGGLAVPVPVEELRVIGQTLVLVHPNGVVTFDLSDPGAPKQLDEYPSEPILAHAFSGEMLYLFNSGLAVLDLSDPADLKLAGTAQPSQGYIYITSAAASGERLYGFSSFGEFGYCQSSLVEYDISSPAAPELLTPLREGGGEDPAQITLRCADQSESTGDWLLTSDWSGLNAIDLSGAPSLAATFQADLPAENLAVQDGVAYWSDGLVPDSLHVLDLRDPAAPDAYPPAPPQWLSYLAAAPGLLYAPAWQDGLAVLSLGNPLEPAGLSAVSAEALGGGAALGALEGETLYLKLDGERVQAVDVSDPAAPAVKGSYTPACSDGIREPIAVAAAPQRLFLLRRDCQDYEAPPVFEMVNAANPAELSWLGELALPVGGEIFDLAAQGDLVLATTYPWAESRASGELLVLDASSPESPNLLARLVVPGTLKDVQIVDGYAYLAAGDAGMWAVDISDPAQPFLAGHVDTPGEASAVAVEGGKLYVADGVGGITVYAISNNRP